MAALSALSLKKAGYVEHKEADRKLEGKERDRLVDLIGILYQRNLIPNHLAVVQNARLDLEETLENLRNSLKTHEFVDLFYPCLFPESGIVAGVKNVWAWVFNQPTQAPIDINAMELLAKYLRVEPLKIPETALLLDPAYADHLSKTDAELFERMVKRSIVTANANLFLLMMRYGGYAYSIRIYYGVGDHPPVVHLTPLQYVAAVGQKTWIEPLLQAGMPVNGFWDNNNITALDCALGILDFCFDDLPESLKQDRTEIPDILRKYGALTYAELRGKKKTPEQENG